jgi:hypothetical protein
MILSEIDSDFGVMRQENRYQDSAKNRPRDTVSNLPKGSVNRELAEETRVNHQAVAA